MPRSVAAVRKIFLGSCLVLLAGSASAALASEEIGYPTGALGLSAIERGDWAMAERQLTREGGAVDPAKLINLGEVYYRTGRSGAAFRMWEAALAAPEHFLVHTRDGRVVSTEALAREALSRRRLASIR